MLLSKSLKAIVYPPIITMLSLGTVGCFQPPFNDFKPTSHNFMAAMVQPSKKQLIRILKKQDIEFLEYGDTMTLIVPTDHYFVNGTAEINDICFDGLNNIVRLLRLYPKCKIYVAGFSDDMGTAHHKLYRTTAQSQAMLTFLWASHIPAEHMNARGYGALFAIGDNQFVHGAAYNRRIEIQWSKVCDTDPSAAQQAQANMK